MLALGCSAVQPAARARCSSAFVEALRGPGLDPPRLRSLLAVAVRDDDNDVLALLALVAHGLPWTRAASAVMHSVEPAPSSPQ